MKCTVWDQHVEKVIPFCQYDLKEPVIVIIQMCRVKVPENSGEVKICSSYDATQLLFNSDCDECTEFRDRLNSQPTPLKSITSNSSLSYSTYTLGDQSSSNMVFSTISELYERSETGEYWVPCIILELDCNLIDWYYLSCISGRCNKKVDLKGGMYVCGKCGTHCDTPKLRYKIKLRVYDAKGSAPFLLWDREALDLLGGITAEELKAMQPKEFNHLQLLILQQQAGYAVASNIKLRKQTKHSLSSLTKHLQLLICSNNQEMQLEATSNLGSRQSIA
nr:replication factor A protein 1-like [Ipomoea batatas]